MAKPRLLNGLPHNLVHSFFSTLRYWEKGYMSDWIVNAALEIKTNRITIDILNKHIEPKEIEIKPIMYHLNDLDEIIRKVTNHAGFSESYVIQAMFEIEILENRYIKCISIVIGENGKTFKSKEYFEKSFEEFKAVKLNFLDKFLNWTEKRYFRIKFLILGRYTFRKLKYTKRLENMMN
jgi:hypothetical protein